MQHRQTTITRQFPIETGVWVAEQIKAAMKNVVVHDLARRITAGLAEEHIDPQIAAISEMKAISNFVSKHLRYTRDPYGVELVYGPMAMVERFDPAHPNQAALVTQRTFGEDCDGFAVFTGSLVASVGLQVRVVLVNFKGMQGWNHIFVLGKIPGGDWTALDTSMKYKARQYMRYVNNSMIIQVNEQPL